MVVEEACALGVPAVVLPAGGFAERGPVGLERQRRLVAAAQASGTRVIGPNCMGVISLPDRAAVYIGTIPRLASPGNVSVVAQSGSVAHLLVNTPEIALARVLSSGNEATLSTCDYLEYLLADEETAVILLYLEAYREPGRLLGLAERALALGKPLVTMALGRSAQAQAMAQAHSGALATSYRRLTAALHRGLPLRASVLVGHGERVRRAASVALAARGQQLASLEARLQALDPQRVLERGYARLADGSGRAVQSVQQMAPGDTLQAVLADGSAQVTVREVTPR